MHSQLRILVKYLNFFHSLMDGKAPHASQIAVAQSIPFSLEHLENELEKALPLVEQCKTKDYERVSDLFVQVFIPLRKYTLAVEMFCLVWDEMWGTYLDQKTLNEIERPSIEEAHKCSRMEVTINRIFNLILKFNSLPNKKIIHKRELECTEVQVENFSRVSKKMCSYINTLTTADVYNIDDTSTWLLRIGCNLSDYRCELSFVRDAVQTIAEAYRLKNKNLKRRRNYC